MVVTLQRWTSGQGMLSINLIRSFSPWLPRDKRNAIRWQIIKSKTSPYVLSRRTAIDLGRHQSREEAWFYNV